MASGKLQKSFNKQPSRSEVVAFVGAAAAGNNDAAVIKFLDEYGSAYIEEKDNNGFTALMDATACGRLSTVKLLLERGADIEQKNEHGWTPLMRATWNRHAAIVALLLEKGADLDEKNPAGDTALMMSRKRDKPEITSLLEKETESRAQRLAEQIRQEAEKKARDLAEDIADFSPALKRDIPVRRPFRIGKAP